MNPLQPIIQIINLTMLNKKPPTAPPLNNSLKNIINETKVPLSKYINKKAMVVDRNMSYMDKLKSMLTNNPKFQPRGGESANYVYTQANTINNEMVDETPLKHKRHERTESQFTTICQGSSQLKYSRISPRLEKSQKKNNQQFLNEIKTDLMIMKKRVVSINQSQKLSCNNLMKNRIKNEIINYNKFVPVPRMEEEMDKSICNRWGKMELTEVLGSGANASVREGTCNGIKFAVKIYQKYKLLEPRKKKRVYSQIQILKHASEHPNIITMHQAFEDKRQIHVIFEHLSQSITLHQYFRNRMLFIEEKEVQRIFGKILRGVAHLHEEGIAHRDIKPDNILICEDEDGEMLLKIIDFGFATSNNLADLHCGTPNFMAPELLEKVVKYSTTCVDIWALGVTLFYLCEGRYPFKGYDEKDLFRSIRLGKYEFKKIQNESIMEIISEMLDPNPKTRATAKQLLQKNWVINI